MECGPGEEPDDNGGCQPCAKDTFKSSAGFFECEACERLVPVTFRVRFPIKRVCSIFASQFVSSLFKKVLLHF